MKLALCLEFPIALRGGVSVLVETLVLEFVRLGHEVVLVSDDTPETLARSPVAGRLSGHIRWVAGAPTRAQALELTEELIKQRVQLAHFHLGGNFGWGNTIISRCPIYYLNRRGVPCISTVHSVVNLLDGFCGPQKPTWFKLALLPFVWVNKMIQVWSVRCEIAVSQHDLDLFQRWYRLLRNRYVQIYHSRLKEEAVPGSVGPRERTILNVGHIGWRKGQDVLTQAFAKLADRHPDWKLALAGHDGGDGTMERVRALEQAHQLQGRILILGQRDDAWVLMRQAGIYVQPSLAEALGLALQEAMYCGCACIGSRVGGIPELLEEAKTGVLVEPGNSAELAAALEALINDEPRRETYGRAAAASIVDRGMTVAIMVKKHLDLYERTLAQG